MAGAILFLLPSREGKERNDRTGRPPLAEKKNVVLEKKNHFSLRGKGRGGEVPDPGGTLFIPRDIDEGGKKKKAPAEKQIRAD